MSELCQDSLGFHLSLENHKRKQITIVVKDNIDCISNHFHPYFLLIVLVLVLMCLIASFSVCSRVVRILVCLGNVGGFDSVVRLKDVWSQAWICQQGCHRSLLFVSAFKIGSPMGGYRLVRLESRMFECS